MAIRPWGIHQPAVVGSKAYPDGFASYREWCRFLVNDLGMGLFTALLEPGFSELQTVEDAASAGLLVITRPQPDGGEPHPSMRLSAANVARLVSAGSRLVQLGNEPDNAGEWTRDEGGVKHGMAARFGLLRQVMDMAADVIAGGGIALLPPMNAGYDGYDTRTGEVSDRAIDRISYRGLLDDALSTGDFTQLREWAVAGKIACAVHNRPSNHPLDYPNDPTNMADREYFTRKFHGEPPSLKKDATAWRSYELIDDINQEYFGFSLPMYGTEAGYTVEVEDDGRYPKIKDRPDIPRGQRASAYADFSNGKSNLLWAQTDLTVALLERFKPYHPQRWRPALFGVCFYHAMYKGGDSPVEGWWNNGLLGRDLALIGDMRDWWAETANRVAFDGWPAFWLGKPPVAPPPPVIEPKPTPPPVEETPVTYWRLAAIHGSNDRADSADDIAAWADINPPFVLLCEPQFDKDHIRRIREAIPGVRIIGRFWGAPEVGVDAWHCPYGDLAKMYEYGRVLARKANDWGLDAIQWANEPGVDDGNGYWFTEEGYQDIAKGTHALVNGYKGGGGKALLGTVPLAPGNREDDDRGWGYRGADILRPAFERCDMLLLHSYLEDGSNAAADPYPADRWALQLDAYRWGETGKPWAITEFNKDEADNGGRDEQDRVDLVSQARIFFDNLRAHPLAASCWGVAWFIWNSIDPRHTLMRQADYPEARALWREQNRVPLPGFPPPPPVVPPVVPPATHLVLPMRAVDDIVKQLGALWGWSYEFSCVTNPADEAIRACVVAIKDHLAEGVQQ